MIKFKCSQCGTGLSVPQNLAGKTGKCPKCGSLITAAPQAQPAASEPEAVAESSQPAVSTVAEGFEGNTPVGWSDAAPAAQPLPQGNLINCPDCGRQISRLAPNCPGCGRPIAEGDTKGGSRLNNDAKGKTRTVRLLCVLALIILVVGVASVAVWKCLSRRHDNEVRALWQEREGLKLDVRSAKSAIAPEGLRRTGLYGDDNDNAMALARAQRAEQALEEFDRQHPLYMADLKRLHLVTGN